MLRLTRSRPDELDADQRALYDTIVEGPRAGMGFVNPDGTLRGPFGPMLLNPELGSLLQEFGAALRFRGRLSDRAREIVILAAAAARSSRFEQASHEPVGRDVGLTVHEVDALRSGDVVAWPDPLEASAHEAAVALGHRRPVDDDVYRRWTEVLGADGLFEVVALVGYYGLLADLLRVFTPEQ